MITEKDREFHDTLQFIEKLKRICEDGSTWPIGYIYGDSFRVLEKLVRKSYYNE